MGKKQIKQMRILVFGAGVIGTTYAWQLSEAGYDVSLFVRKQRMVRYSHSGISISCNDMRSRKKIFLTTVFRPQTTDYLEPGKEYDLIILTVKNYQLKEALSYISKYSGNAHILLMGNIWDGFDLVKKLLPAGRYLFGFPAMAGGGRTENSINCLLFKNGNTMLGEPDGKVSQRLRDIAGILGSAGLQPKITSNITGWMRAYYIWTAASFGAICKAGGVKSFASGKKNIRQSATAIREGFRVCRKYQTRPWAIFPFLLFYLPNYFVASVLSKSYAEGLQQVMEGHIKHGFDDLKKMFYDIMAEGQSQKIRMPVWQSFEKHVTEAEKKRQTG